MKHDLQNEIYYVSWSNCNAVLLFFGFFAAFGRNHTFAIVVYQQTSLNVETG